MHDLTDHVEKISLAQTPEEAFSIYCKIMKYYGYDRAVYSLITDHPSLELPRQHGLVTNYPTHWMKHYVESNYMEADPVIAQIKQSRSTFYWSDIMKKKNTHHDTTVNMMHEANESGLHNGIGVGFCDNVGEITGIGLCRSTKTKSQETDYEILACVQYLSSYFHETYRDMISKAEEISLTDREIEILHWASEGKSDDVISDILIISLNTVRFHWKNIFKKLNANGRVYATSKALRLNLITPSFLQTTYQKR